MTHMTKDEEEAVARQLEEDAANPDLWEDDTPAEPQPSRRLGAQLTLRLSADVAEQLSGAAARSGMLYTQYARKLIEDGLRASAVVEAGASAGPDAVIGSVVLEVKVLRAQGTQVVVAPQEPDDPAIRERTLRGPEERTAPAETQIG